MNITLLCATRRGLRFLEELVTLAPDDDLTVFSFREDPKEPPFLDDIRSAATGSGASFHESRAVHDPEFRAHWNPREVDLLLAVSWRYLVPQVVFQVPRFGSFVFHDSLLPRRRGF